jgi:ketosteroid isomerase-like protein
MVHMMLREMGVPKSSWFFLMAAIAACALGFALTYSLARQRVASPESNASLTPTANQREQDGLVGPVNRVRTETAKLSVRSGKLVEGARELLESTTYDQQGRRVDNTYYLVSGNSQVGREEYAYDDKGNISELTVRDDNNAILSREVYAYEYDALGNWTRMVTSTVVYEGGKLVPQPTEATYRTITYFFDQAVAEITKSPKAHTGAQGTEEAQEKFASLREALDSWIAATNARDMDKLMEFYDARLNTFYLARNVSRDFVRADKARLFQRADLLDVRAGTPEININRADGTALMYFRKQYVMAGKGQERSGEVLQQLRWRRTGEGWKIIGERDAQVIR